MRTLSMLMLLIILTSSITSIMSIYTSPVTVAKEDEGLRLRVDFLLKLATRALNLTLGVVHDLSVNYGLEIPQGVNNTISIAERLLIQAKREYDEGNYTGAAKLAIVSMKHCKEVLAIVTKLARKEIKEFRKAEDDLRARGILVAIDRFRIHLDRLSKLAEANIEDEELLKEVKDRINTAFKLLDEAESELKAGNINASARLLGEARKAIAGIEGIIFPRVQMKGLKIRLGKYIKALINASISFIRELHGFDLTLQRLIAIKTLNQTMLPAFVRMRIRLLNSTLRDIMVIRDLVREGNFTQALKLLLKLRLRLRRLIILRREIHEIKYQVKKLELKNATETLKENLKELKLKLSMVREVLKGILKPKVFELIEIKFNQTMGLLEEVEELIEKGNFTQAWKLIHELKLRIVKEIQSEVHKLVRKAQEIAPRKFRKAMKNATLVEEIEELKERITKLKRQAHDLNKFANNILKSVRKLLDKIPFGPAKKRIERIIKELERSIDNINDIITRLEELEGRIGKENIETLNSIINEIAKDLSSLITKIANLKQEAEEVG